MQKPWRDILSVMLKIIAEHSTQIFIDDEDIDRFWDGNDTEAYDDFISKELRELRNAAIEIFEWCSVCHLRDTEELNEKDFPTPGEAHEDLLRALERALLSPVEFLDAVRLQLNMSGIDVPVEFLVLKKIGQKRVRMSLERTMSEREEVALAQFLHCSIDDLRLLPDAQFISRFVELRDERTWLKIKEKLNKKRDSKDQKEC